MIQRRYLIKKILFGLSSYSLLSIDGNIIRESPKRKLRHSVARWCFGALPIEALIEVCENLGIASIELLDPSEYTVVKRAGLECAMANGSSLHITQGFNNPDYHDRLLKDYTRLIPQAADHGVQNIICFSGNRRGMKDEDGLKNCAEGLKPCLELAEKYNVNMHMELLNSKIDHQDYMCDHSSWAFKLAELLNSPRFKILFDIYHMQIMEGNIINTMKQNLHYIGHIHTAGVPGRGIFDENQELNYSGICQALYENGYEGYIGHEFIPPTGLDTGHILQKAIDVCEFNL